MKCLVVRKAGKNDIEKFLEVYKSAYEGMKKYFYNKTGDVKRYFKWLLRHADGFFVLEGNEAISFIACDSDWIGYDGMTGAIHEIIVKKEWKRKGIGKMMVRIAEIYLKGKIELWAGKENREAIKFYEKMGYERREEINEWIRMVKKID